MLCNAYLVFGRRTRVSACVAQKQDFTFHRLKRTPTYRYSSKPSPNSKSQLVIEGATQLGISSIFSGAIAD